MAAPAGGDNIGAVLPSLRILEQARSFPREDTGDPASLNWLRIRDSVIGLAILVCLSL